jgi:Neuraminidase (sialidase)
MDDRATRKWGPLNFLACLAFCAGMAVGQGLFRLGPDDFVYVCRDAGAGGYEAFPDVCRLIAVFYAGYGHVSLPDERHPRGGRISYCLSSDEGKTWSEARILYDGPDDDRDPSIVQLSNGMLICNFFSLRKKEAAGDKETPWTGLGSWMVVSQDTGKTWSEPWLIAKDYYCSAPIRELPSGRLILGLYGETGRKSHGAVTISEDDGNTWGMPVDIDNGGYKLDAETDFIRLKDGSLYAAQREPEKTMCYSVSKDDGRTWSLSKPIGFPGHCPYLLRTADNVIILAHRLPQTSLHYSLDEAKTWSANILVDDFLGAYLSMVNLRDGSILIVYYEEGERSNIRARRFRATRKGIEWLKPLN